MKRKQSQGLSIIGDSVPVWAPCFTGLQLSDTSGSACNGAPSFILLPLQVLPQHTSLKGGAEEVWDDRGHDPRPGMVRYGHALQLMGSSSGSG